MYKRYCEVFNPIKLLKFDQMIKNKKIIFGQADNFSVTHYTAVKSAFHFLGDPVSQICLPNNASQLTDIYKYKH